MASVFDVIFSAVVLIGCSYRVNGLNGLNATVMQANQAATLLCLKDTSDDDIVWTRNGNQLSSSGNYGISSDSSSSNLTVQNVGENDVGLYVCKRQPDGATKTLEIYAAPILATQFGMSVSATEGKSVSLTCYYWGNPLPTVSWTDDNGITLEPSSNSQVSFTPITVMSNNQVPNGEITISDLKREDQGDVTCWGRNSVGATNNTVLVRVHDRLAALWPFIGILIIVLLVIIIIIIAGIVAAKKEKNI